MLKIRITLICCCIILFATCLLGCSSYNKEYLRIHVRANSNAACDQEIKYLIKDEVVEFLTPLVATCASKEQAIKTLKENESAINQLIAGLLIKNGFNYGCKIAVKGENFPTRVYEGLTLSAGYYDALIIELGSGQGDNWWCVVYPPLCFTGSEDITYRSKIWDLIKGR